MKKLKKVNWHFTKRCNFSCKYCFVKPMHHFEYKDLQAIEILSNYFEEINLVGGEPTIDDEIEKIIDFASERFSKVTMVTNGYNLANKPDSIKNLEKLSSIGISIDFFDKENNIKIGRNRGEDSLDIQDYLKIKQLLEQNNIEFKVNLMISKMNYDFDFNKELELLKPSRLKVIAIMDLFEKKHHLGVTEEEFKHFTNRHELSKYTNRLVLEAPGEMIDAYYMVDGDGSLFVNTNFEINVKANIFDKDFKEKLDSYKLNTELYNKRY